MTQIIEFYSLIEIPDEWQNAPFAKNHPLSLLCDHPFETAKPIPTFLASTTLNLPTDRKDQLQKAGRESLGEPFDLQR